MKHHLFLVILYALLHQREVFATETYAYKAAVLEYGATFIAGEAGTEVLKKNVPNYVKYIEQASNEDVDIIVFPEIGLTGPMTQASINRKTVLSFGTEVPDPNDNISPCNSVLYAQHLKNLSCAALENRIYVVVNLVEIFNCTGQLKCPADNIFIYNTNVVFDRAGTIIARYRKYNLFFEPIFDVTDEAELVTFDTDFGVTFGMFICFDILFKTPALDLVIKKNIRNFVYSTAWHSELPFLTAVQTQMGWAYANDITLLASGYNEPEKERDGTGIYFGRNGPITQIFPLTKINKMLIGTIPNNTSNYNKHQHILLEDSKGDDIILGREDLKSYSTAIISEKYFTKELCNNELCCQFEIESFNISIPSYVYRVVVLDGIRGEPHVAQLGIQTCGVVNCLDMTIDSCGIRNRTMDTGMVFKSITIRGNFSQNDNTFHWPSTVKSNLLTYQSDFLNYNASKDAIEIHLTKEVDDLLTFGIAGRNFILDERADK